MMTTTRASKTRWKTANTWAGRLVFGFPAAMTVPALLSTFVRFGLWETLAAAVPLTVVAWLPLLLWHRYTRHRPSSRSTKIAWALVAMVALAGLALSPLFFWAGPALIVLFSEVLRLALGPSLASLTAATRTRHHQPKPRRSK